MKFATFRWCHGVGWKQCRQPGTRLPRAASGIVLTDVNMACATRVIATGTMRTGTIGDPGKRGMVLRRRPASANAVSLRVGNGGERGQAGEAVTAHS
jgi:hypothetical protein